MLAIKPKPDNEPTFDPEAFIAVCRELQLNEAYFDKVLALKYNPSSREAEVFAGQAMCSLLIQFNNRLGNGSLPTDIILDRFAAGDFLSELSKYKIAAPERSHYVLPLQYSDVPDYYSDAVEIVESARKKVKDAGGRWKLSDTSIRCMEDAARSR